MLMNVRFALQPWWVRFLLLLPAYAVLFGLATHFMPGATDSVASSTVAAVFFGVAMAGIVAYQGQATRKAALEALAGLGDAERSQAIGAVTDGVVPADLTVRYAAGRLGLAFLNGKTLDEIERRERRAWIAVVIFVALAVVWAVWMATTHSSAHATLYVVILVLFVAIAMPLAIVRGRRFRRNCALLSDSLPSA